MAKQPAGRLGRNEWIRAGLEVLMSDGADAVAVETLARKLSVTKGSFYWHFKNRNELLTALLVAWEKEGTIKIIFEVDREASDPAERLRQLALTTFQVTPFDRLEGAIRSWAMSNGQARKVVRRVDRRRLRYVTELLVDAGVDSERAGWRANLFYRALIGEFAYRSTGGKPLEVAALEETIDSLLERSC